MTWLRQLLQQMDTTAFWMEWSRRPKWPEFRYGQGQTPKKAPPKLHAIPRKGKR